MSNVIQSPARENDLSSVIGRWACGIRARLGSSVCHKVSWVLAALITVASPVRAATWEGIDVAIDSDWPGCGNGGYFPLRMTVVNRGQPRELIFTFASNYGQMPAVTKSLSLQTERVTFSLLVPCVGPEAYGTVRVSVDGGNVPELSQSVSLPAGRNWDTQGPAVLLVDSKDTDWSEFKVGVENALGITAAAASAGSSGYYTPTITAGDDHKYIPLEALPGEWQAYTGLDLVVLSLAILQRLDADDRGAMLRWVDCGGTLLVFDTGAEETESALQRVEAVLSPVPVDQHAWTSSGAGRGRHWGRDQLLGRVLAIPGNPFREFESSDWEVLLSGLGKGRWEWTDRYGMSARYPSSNFMEFLIPSVKGVPVVAFLVLITLFAIVIGPVNYLYLWKQRRLYLLIVTIPAIALITSLSLFGYSVVAHGFATRSRVRSLTLVDQPSNTAVSSSRLSLYSGLAPSSGLTFTRDTAVFPIWAPDGGFESGTVNWTESQHLRSGWLRSRTRTQFLVQTHRKERGRLEVTPEPGALSVANGFEWDLNALVVSDDEGQLYFAEGLAAGAAARLAPMTDEQSLRLSAAINADPLVAPAYAPSSSYAYGRGGYYPGYYGGYTPPTVAYSSNQAEQMLTFLTQPTSYQSNSNRPRWYAAILSESPGLDLGVTNAREEASVHILVGKY